MPTTRRAALMWSGGKDSALALAALAEQTPNVRVETLLTCLSQAYDRVSMHGVRRALVVDQADAIGLPVEFVAIPAEDDPSCPIAHRAGPGTAFPPNDVYSRAMLAAFRGLRGRGIDTIVFGDIFLEDLRAYRDRLLDDAGLSGLYPLWGLDTSALFDGFVRAGYRAICVCVDTDRLPESLSGRLLDAAFLAALPEGADPCGERGEYHSFVNDGPPFRRPVDVRVGGVHFQPPFAFRELLGPPERAG